MMKPARHWKKVFLASSIHCFGWNTILDHLRINGFEGLGYPHTAARQSRQPALGCESPRHSVSPIPTGTSFTLMAPATTITGTISGMRIWAGQIGEKGQLYQEIEGLYIREFTNGWAVYNHSGEAQVITLPEEVQGVASGLANMEHVLTNLDGEMYLRVKPKNPADVNGDGVVNIFDLTLVAQGFGTDSLEADVNGDGVVNVFDLVFVANQF